MLRVVLAPVEAYLKGLRKPLAVMVPLFIAFIAVGAMLPEPVQDALTESMGRQFEPMLRLPPVLLMIAIFLNNTLKCLAAMLLGIFFGVAPIMFVAANGIIIGLVASSFTSVKGPLATMAAILPHGVIEIPAFIVSSAIGLRLGMKFYRRIKGEHGLGAELAAALLFFLVYLVPAFFVAAFIEAYVTPVILSLVVRP